MISTDEFWETEIEAPILRRNEGFATKETSSELIDRANGFLVSLDAYIKNQIQESPSEESGKVSTSESLIGDIDDEALLKKVENCDPGALRIFTLDAERTFKSEKCRKIMIRVLCALYEHIQDYHQGMGYIVSFLLLFLKETDVIRLVLGLHRYYIPGYFKAAPTAYVRDARVYQIVLSQKNEKIASHIQDIVCPETYISKWFVGMNIHVLNFKALFYYFEQLLSQGPLFLFQYAINFVNTFEEILHSTKDVSMILAILRLEYGNDQQVLYETLCETINESETFQNYIMEYSIESKSLHWKYTLHEYLVITAKDFDLSDIDIEAIRDEVSQQMKAEEEARRKREAELEYSDSEIVFSDEEDEEDLKREDVD